MSKTSLKKLSAAAVVAVMGLGAATQAAPIYSTGFEASEGYVAGNNLAGQPTVGSTWAINPTSGSTSGTATVSATGGQTGPYAAHLYSDTQGTAAGDPAQYTDFFNSATSLSAAAITNINSTGGIVSVAFGLNRSVPTGSETTAQPVNNGNVLNTRAGFGIEVMDPTDSTVLASVFIRNSGTSTVPVEASVPRLFVSNSGTSGNANTEVLGTTGTAAADGTYGSYSLNLNFATSMFTVTGPGGTSIPYAFSSSYTGGGIGGIFLAADAAGYNDAYFDNFSVAAVPEPVSVAMVGMGGLMLMARRRRQTV